MSSTNVSAPLFVQFAQQVHAEIRRLGLPEPTLAPTPTGFPENDGYFFVEWGPHGQAPALIIPKSKVRMGNLHSHVDLSGIPGVIPLPKKNGRVVCHFEPDVSKVSKALASFMGASKRPVAAPVRRLPGDSQAVQATASQATPSDVRVGTIEDLTAGLSQVGSYSDDEAEEALQALTRG